MKREKKFFDNERLIIIVGTTIFFILAISIGIVMYMSTKKNLEISEKPSNVIEEMQNEENTENASTSIGKTVEEQAEQGTLIKENSEENETANTNTTNNASTSNTKNTANTSTTNTATSEANTNETNTTNAQNAQNAQNEEQPKEEPKNETTETQEQVTETKQEVTFIKPTDGEIIREFAKDNLIYSETLKEWITHTAVDIKADKTSVIKSSADGIVKSIVNDPRYGLTVIIEHDDGYETVYSNLLTAEFVVEGEEVSQGQTIGTVGNTASFESSMDCHLHFELLKDGEYLDPTIYLK